MSLPLVELSPGEVLAADIEAFPDDPQSGQVVPIASGASGRLFFRIIRGSGTRILMAYPNEPRENQFFTGIGAALYRSGIPVPRILGADPHRGWVWLEDLGDVDLYSLRDQASPRRAAYQQAIKALNRVQRLPSDVFSSAGVETHAPFDEDLYDFEHRYFDNELVSRLSQKDGLTLEIQKEMDVVRHRLLASAETWVHRDFQSKNLMLDSQNHLRIVDFQGIRRGHRYYDLASLLCDPYANLPKDEREALFLSFCQGADLDPGPERSDFVTACCQRLMQALGAYGRFGLGGSQIPFFREKIPAALGLLQEHAHEAELPALSRLAGALKSSLKAGHQT